jgi:hypothetical protein
MDKSLFVNKVVCDTYNFKNIDMDIINLYSINNNKCLGPCYPSKYIYKHPLFLQEYINLDKNTCPIKYNSEVNLDSKFLINDECATVTKNYDKYNPYKNDYINYSLAYNNDAYLKQIYNINNIADAKKYLELNIETLPLLSQKRILNSIYNVYLNDDSFPNKTYINLVKNILKKIFEIEISSTKIYKQIMKNKKKSIDTTNTFDIFLFLFNKYCKKL